MAAYIVLSASVGSSNSAFAADLTTTHEFPVPFSHPIGLVEGPDGTLYGTFFSGNGVEQGGNATAYSVRSDGSGLRILHRWSDSVPNPGLALGADGFLYGTSYYGDDFYYGAVFRFRTDGSGYETLHTFVGGPLDAKYPTAAPVLDGNGHLFGTTERSHVGTGCGSVYRMNTDGTGFEVLHFFGAGAELDGCSPEGALIRDSAGRLYGTSWSSTVFAIDPDGSNFANLHVLQAGEGHALRAGLAFDGIATLYGAAEGGGAHDAGTVFKVGTDGLGFAVLHSFTGSSTEGGYPTWPPVVVDATHVMVGTSLDLPFKSFLSRLPSNGADIEPIAELPQQGNSYYPISLSRATDGRVLFATAGDGDTGLGALRSIGADGTGIAKIFDAAPLDGGGHWGPTTSPLVADGQGYVYGATMYGGLAHLGALYRMKPDGTEFTVLHSFIGGKQDGRGPSGGLAFDGAHTLYGMTAGGGEYDAGVIYKIDANGTNFTVLRAFLGSPNDGKGTNTALVLSAPWLYGLSISSPPASAGGYVFKVGMDGGGFTKLRALPYAEVGQPDQLGGLALDGVGTLFGAAPLATFALGTDGNDYQVLIAAEALPGANPSFTCAPVLHAGVVYGCYAHEDAGHHAAVFSISPSGEGFTVRHVFPATADSRPVTSLAPAGPGTLVGIGRGYGSLFKLDDDGTYREIYRFREEAAETIARPAPTVLSAGTVMDLVGTTGMISETVSGTTYTVHDDYLFTDGFDDEAY